MRDREIVLFEMRKRKREEGREIGRWFCLKMRKRKRDGKESREVESFGNEEEKERRKERGR